MKKEFACEFFGDEIERSRRFDPLTGHTYESLNIITFFPAKQFVTPADKLNRALRHPRRTWATDHRARIPKQTPRSPTATNAHRIRFGDDAGNGLLHRDRKLFAPFVWTPPGSRPYTIIDFFPDDFLTVIDESHATIPQIGGMYEGDRSRKTVLVNFGFRLPSALDNRPLNFDEFMKLTNQTIYASATPAEFEIQNSVVGKQRIRPTQTTAYRS